PWNRRRSWSRQLVGPRQPPPRELALGLEPGLVCVPGLGSKPRFPQLELLHLVGRRIGQALHHFDIAWYEEVGCVVVDVACQFFLAQTRVRLQDDVELEFSL